MKFKLIKDYFYYKDYINNYTDKIRVIRVIIKVLKNIAKYNRKNKLELDQVTFNHIIDFSNSLTIVETFLFWRGIYYLETFNKALDKNSIEYNKLLLKVREGRNIKSYKNKYNKDARKECLKIEEKYKY